MDFTGTRISTPAAKLFGALATKVLEQKNLYH
jgi:hypothetical protein